MAWEITYLDEFVRLAIIDWPIGIRMVYTRITDRIKIHGPNLGMPFTRAMGNGLFEIRVKGMEGIARAFFCTVVGHRGVVLHSIIKKTDKTPLRDLAIARTRLNQDQMERGSQ